MKTIGELAPMLFADRQARSGLMPPWANGKNAQGVSRHHGPQADRRHLQRRRGGALPLEGFGAERTRKSACGCWTASPTACGRGSRNSPGTLHDRRWLPVVEELYDWHYRNERYLRNEEPLARVAMVYSQQTAQFYGGAQARQKVEDHTLGYYQALIEARIPFEMVHDRLLDAEHIGRFKALILPNIAALSDAQCARFASS